jgi:hypothetical protein
MRKQYLHLSAYSCDRCDGPVVAGSLAIRENEISKETEIRQVGAVCLTCGHRQSKGTNSIGLRDLPPVPWEFTRASDDTHFATAFGEMLSRAETHSVCG